MRAPLIASALLLVLSACDHKSDTEAVDTPEAPRRFAAAPLVSHIYTADPAVHVWDGVIYIYPSHDIENDEPHDAAGSHFVMRDYRVLSMTEIPGEVQDHGVALDVEDIPWAKGQLWAPDAARKGDNYYLYFPAKDHEGVFYIGAAVSDSPTGPFTAMDTPIAGSFSNDPAVFEDDDGHYYMYWGGNMGGQLQRWRNGHYTGEDHFPADNEPALAPYMAKLAEDMVSFAETPQPVILLKADGSPMLAKDRYQRFFEGAWMHKFQGTYYFSYSTGDTHKIVYATGDNPYGPFTYQGVILKPVLGWTTHHAIVEFNDQWYLFYHDTELSGGQTHLRNIKVLPLTHNNDGSIETLNPFKD